MVLVFDPCFLLPIDRPFVHSLVHLFVCDYFNYLLGVLPETLGRGVPHDSQNPDPISDQNIYFFIPLFKPDPENLYPISDLVTF